MMSPRSQNGAVELTGVQPWSAVQPADGHAPWRWSSDPPKERVVHLHLATPEEPQKSLTDAVRSIATTYERLDWPALDRKPHVVARALAETVRRVQPTLVFMQIQRGGVVTSRHVLDFRRHLDPRAVVVHWSGDLHQQVGPRGHWAHDLGSAGVLLLHSSASHVEIQRSHGVAHVGYLQIGYDVDRYYPPPPGTSRHGVAYLASRYQHLRFGNDDGLRVAVADELHRALGCTLAFHGSGWGKRCWPLAPAESGHLYRRNLIAVSVSHASDLQRYSSDRLIRALACGCLVLCKRFAGAETWGLVHEKNVIFFETASECAALALRWHNDPEQAANVGARGAELARDHHSWDVRMRELAVYLAAIRSDPITAWRPW